MGRNLKGFGQLESITPDLPYWVLRETAKSDAIWPSSIMCTVSIRRGEISTVWRCAGRWWWWLLWRLASGVWDKKKSEVSGRVAPRPSPACHVSTGHLAARTGDGTHARRCHAPHGGALRRGGAGKPIARNTERRRTELSRVIGCARMTRTWRTHPVPRRVAVGRYKSYCAT
jgi:hypothetical protein